MKKPLLFILLITCGLANAQMTIQSVNSGALVTSGSSVSIGEIIVVPDNPNQTSSGIIAILSQSQQTLEIAELEIASGIVVYPNPTVSKVFFKSADFLTGQKASVYNNAGQLVLKTAIADDNSLNLEALSSGIYLIRFEDKKMNPFKIIKH